MTTRWFGRGAAALTALLMIAGLALAPIAPAATAQEAETDASIRFVHVLAGGGPVDVYLDGELVAEGITYASATEFMPYEPGNHTVQVTNAGDPVENAFLEEAFESDSGEAFNVIVGGRPDDFQVAVFEVNLDAITPGFARYRFVMASPDADNLLIQLDVSAGEGIDTDTAPGIGVGDPLVGGPYLGEGDYREIDAGTYDIVAFLDETDDVRLEAADVAMNEGFVYDLVVVGSEDSERLDILPLITQVSRPCSELLGVGDSSDACIRFVHTSPDAGQVDIYLDGSLVVEGISYGTATEFAAIPEFEHQIQVVPSTGSVDDAALDETMDFQAGQAYQAVVTGFATDDDDDGNDLELQTVEVDLTPVPDGQTRVRVLHNVPDAGEVGILVSGEDIFEDVGFGDESNYEVVDAGSYDIQVATTDDDAVIAEVTGLELQAGTVYDVFAIGRAADNTIELLVLETNATFRTGDVGTPQVIQEGEGDVDPADVETTQPTVVGAEGDDEGPAPEDEVTEGEEVLTPAPSPDA